MQGVADSAVLYNPILTLQAQPPDTQLTTQSFDLAGLLQSAATQNPELMEILSSSSLNSIRPLLEVSNIDETPPNSNCVKYYGKEEQWKCLFVQFAYATL